MLIESNPLLSKAKAKIMLLGTFHFQNRGLDLYKPQFDVAILSTQRQQEVMDVVSRLALFQPSKIAVERRPERQEEMDQEYGAYLRGDFQLPGDEVYQLGFQLAQRLKHPQVYCVDAWGRYYEPPLDLEHYAANRTTKELQEFLTKELDFDPFDALTTYAAQHGQADLLAQWLAWVQQIGRQGDEAKTQRTLRETLLLANVEENIWQSHGSYLTGPFKIGRGHEYPGVDYVTAWYSRNLRIFANLQRIVDRGDDRILLIIGSGHVPILRHCILGSPEYEIEEVHDYLA